MEKLWRRKIEMKNNNKMLELCAIYDNNRKKLLWLCIERV